MSEAEGMLADHETIKVVVGMAKTSAHALAAVLFMAARYISEPEGRRTAQERAELAVHEANCLFYELDLLPEHVNVEHSNPDGEPVGAAQ